MIIYLITYTEISNTYLVNKYPMTKDKPIYHVKDK